MATEENAWVKTPEVRATVEHGKGKSVVRGPVRIAFTGADTAFVDTAGAHHNDDNPAITYRDREWLASVHAQRGVNGGWESVHESVRARGSWADAPRSYHAAIIAALLATLADVDTPELQRAGAYAHAAQALMYAQRNAEEARTAMKAAETELAAVRQAMRDNAPDA